MATILSAQCTDKRVNMVTPALFKKYRTAKDYADAPQAEFEKAIKSTGFYRAKTKSIRGAMRAIAEEHGGKVPDTMEELNALPGVGRKTANVVLGNAFHKNVGIVVDTHVIRLSQRLGLTKHKDAGKDRARLDEAGAARALDRLESLAHLARPSPLLCAQAGLLELRGFQVMSQRQSFPANRPGKNDRREDCLTSALSAFNRLVVTGRACFVILGLRAHASKLFLESSSALRRKDPRDRRVHCVRL